MAEPDEVRSVTRPQWHILGITKYPSWFGHWILDNLMRHVLAHLVGRYADGSLEIKCLPGGYLDVATLMACVKPDGEATAGCAAGVTSNMSMGDARPRIVRITAGAVCVYINDWDGATARSVGILYSGNELVARFECQYVQMDGAHASGTTYATIQWWNLA